MVGTRRSNCGKVKECQTRHPFGTPTPDVHGRDGHVPDRWLADVQRRGCGSCQSPVPGCHGCPPEDTHTAGEQRCLVPPRDPQQRHRPPDGGAAGSAPVASPGRGNEGRLDREHRSA